MKPIRLLAALAALLALLSLTVGAAQIYLPDTAEVGDRETKLPYVTFYETDGSLNTDKVPRPVDVAEDILLPTALYGGAAVVAYAALRIIRYLIERKAAKKTQTPKG